MMYGEKLNVSTILGRFPGKQKKKEQKLKNTQLIKFFVRIVFSQNNIQIELSKKFNKLPEQIVTPIFF